MTSRFTWRGSLTPERLKDFVAIDTLTAQVPLIDVQGTRHKHRIVRIWTAYDTTREHGTYIEVSITGLVTTVTVYPSGRAESYVNRPADRINVRSKGKRVNKGLRAKAKQDTNGKRSRSTKTVHERT